MVLSSVWDDIVNNLQVERFLYNYKLFVYALNKQFFISWQYPG